MWDVCTVTLSLWLCIYFCFIHCSSSVTIIKILIYFLHHDTVSSVCKDVCMCVCVCVCVCILFPLVSASLHIVSLAQALNGGNRARDEDITTPKPFVFNLLQSCDNWVVFAWDSAQDGFPHPFGPPHFSSCEITYMNQHSQVAKLVMVVLHTEIKTIRLSNLNKNTHYAASMTCNETLTSNTVQFVTGKSLSLWK